MRVSGAWANAGPSQTVLAMLRNAGHQAFFVGGCVRNDLLGHPVSDIDVATDALPEEVMTLAQEAQLRCVPTGIDHGTVTVIAHDVPHEITTFRKDVATDGRHAQVSFSKELIDDARRRDFTMNALYADAAGLVVDPLNGANDLVARRVQFIGDANTRIKEDYLRILRFFRFHAWFGDVEAGLDPDGLAACAALAEGIDRLSKERIGGEVKRLLSAPDPAPSVAAMRHAGVLHRVLPGSDDSLLGPLIHMEEGTPPNYLRRLAILGGEDAAQNLRLAKADARKLETLRSEMGHAHKAKALGYLHGVDLGLDVLILRSAMSHTAPTDGDLNDLKFGQSATFPISAADLMPKFEGAALGQKLKVMETAWIASDFSMTRDALFKLAGI